MVEPEPVWAPMLIRMAAREEYVTFHAAAAWHKRGNLTYFRSSNNEASSLVKTTAMRFGLAGSITVPTLDVDALLRQVAAKGCSPLMLKLDIEAGEYDLLPYLMISGALCLVSHLHVEWHLNALPSARRLEGLALQLSLRSNLQIGCKGQSPTLVTHEMLPHNNWHLQVDGLSEEASKHNNANTTSEGSLVSQKWLVAHKQSEAHSLLASKRARLKAARSPSRTMP